MSTDFEFINEMRNVGLISIAGEQRHEYLHGQLTIATKEFEVSSAKIAAHCDFKGKMFSAPILSAFEDRFLMSANKEALEVSFEQLKKYGVFSKVTIEKDDEHRVVGVAGEKSIQHLNIIFPELSNENLSTTSNEFGQAICFNDTSLRYICYLTNEAIQRLEDIRQHEIVATDVNFNALQIEAGIAEVHEKTISSYVPQMLNFQAIDAIDFDKGCYMGQEVIARTKFLGKNKRATFILKGIAIDGSAVAISPGDDLEIQIGENWRRSGTINRVTVRDKQIIALGVLSNDTEVGAVLRLKGSEQLLTVNALPYSL